MGRITCDGAGPTCKDTGTFQPDGNDCGTGKVCSKGVCSTCAQNASCDRGQACKLGRTDCATGVATCAEAGNADNGSPCGNGKVCASGQCVTCSDGAACVPTNPCHQGSLSCAGGTPSCTDLATNVTDGTACGTDKVCSQGACVSCKAGETCAVPGAPCRTGQTACNTGQATCVAMGNAQNGKTCDTAKVCSDGACVACMNGASCVPTNLCHTGTLDCTSGTGVCKDTGTSVSNGASCGTDLVCNQGTCAACTAGKDCTPAGTTCKVGKTSCASGASICVQSGNAADGSSCGNNQVCKAGNCTDCAAGSACTPPSAPCHNGALNCATGTPTCTDLTTSIANGTSCGTNLVCSAGSCIPCTAGTVCTPNGNLCQTGTTVCSSGSSVCMLTGNIPNGTSCGSSLVCSGGACVACTSGSACTPSSAPCHLGMLSCATGSQTCTDTGANADNGTSCGTNLACASGACNCVQGTSCTPPGNVCKQGQTSCTTGASVCLASGNVPDSPAVTCAAGKTCQSGSCAPLPGCPSDPNTPKLDCPCPTSGTTKCAGSNQSLRLVCATVAGQTGTAWKVLAPCNSGENCDTTSGSCKTIVPECVGHAPGFAFCAAAAGAPLPAPYLDVRKTCGPDLVTTTDMTCSGVCDNALGCQNPRCGDSKIEGSEQCDDGNTQALDGCEPSGGPTSASACTKSSIVAISAGQSHTCGLFNGGYVRCWGANDHNQLGLGHTQFEGDRKPFQLTELDAGGNPQPAGPINFGGLGAVAVSAGGNFSCALLSDSSVSCWGANDTNQLGLGNTTEPDAKPANIGKVPLGVTAKSVSAGVGFACALLTNGTVRCWGVNAGKLGTGDTTVLTTSTPAQIATAYPGWVSLGGTANQVTVGGSAACARLTDGTIRCWGSNGSGALGVGMTTQLSRTMVPSAYATVQIPATATDVTAGLGSICARLSDASARCWGDNSAGQLGIGTTASIGDNETPSTDGTVQTSVSGVDKLITGPGNFMCAFFANNGGLHCWGDNGNGQLGYPDITTRGATPATVPKTLPAVSFGTGVSATSVAVGLSHTCAVLSNGQLHCWGGNASGQLGLGFVSSGTTPYVGGSSTTTPDNAVTNVPLFK